MKNKADLYKLQKPGEYLHKERKIINFRALVGTYEKNRAITVNAYTIHHAIQEADNYCRSDEIVMEISRDDVVLWKHKYL